MVRDDKGRSVMSHMDRRDSGRKDMLGISGTELS